LVQALVQPADGQGRARLLRGGFVQAAELSYLVSPRPSQTAAAPSGVLEFEPYNADQESRLAALIGATYDGTLDCPLLNGLRSLPDVLAGYRTVGAYRPEDWQFVRRSGHDVGCLLLAEHPAADHTELIYMGLVPAARGCGLGREITLRALYLAARRGQSLVLAVDAANTPACALYAGAGLVEWDRRAVLLRAWNERGEEQPLTARQVT
jgi:ribosomal protein S18 acetylase RimI-like enzyme